MPVSGFNRILNLRTALPPFPPPLSLSRRLLLKVLAYSQAACYLIPGQAARVLRRTLPVVTPVVVSARTRINIVSGAATNSASRHTVVVPARTRINMISGLGSLPSPSTELQRKVGNGTTRTAYSDYCNYIVLVLANHSLLYSRKSPTAA